MTHETIAIAGTFDHLHKGHGWYILKAFSYGKHVVIGLTSDEMAGKKSKVKSFSQRPIVLWTKKSKVQFKIQKYDERKRHLEAFLKREHLLDRVEIVKIEDVYGPAVEPKSDIEALVVTKETINGARIVNRKRKALGLKALKIITIPLVLAEDQKRIASTRIRLGQIDRWGRVYSKLPIFGKKIPEPVRLKLKNPIGELVQGDPKNIHDVEDVIKSSNFEGMVITVGDEVTKLMNVIGPDKLSIAIVDFHVNRQKKYTLLSDLGFHDHVKVFDMLTVKNPAGYVSASLTRSIKKAIKRYLFTAKMQVIRVIGEEDLAGIPVILFAPLGSTLIYGQPGEGIVVVEVTEEKKRELLQLVRAE